MIWNISDKVRLLFGTVVLAFAGLGIFLYFNIERLESHTRWINHSHQVLHSLQALYADLKEAQANYADYLLTRDRNFARNCQADLDQMDLEMGKALDLAAGDSLWSQNLGDLQAAIGKRAGALREGLAYARAGRPDLAITGLDSAAEKKSNQEIKALINRMSGMQVWLLKVHNDLELSSTHKNVNFMLFIALAVVLACGLAIILINRQINDRQSVLNRLRASEERFRFLAENAGESFVTMDDQGKIIDLNPASEAMYGYAKADLIGKDLTLLMPQDFLKEHGPGAFRKFLEITDPKAGVSTVELRARKSDSYEFPVEVSLSSWKTKDGIFHTAITRDITERKFFMRTLLKNEHRLFQFLEAIPVGILVRDPFGIPYYSNQAAKDILGRETMRDSNPDKIPEAYQVYRVGTDKPYPAGSFPITLALKGERSYIDDAEVRRLEKTIPIQVWGAPIFDENGSVKYALAAIIDATRQREMTESLQSREEFFRNLFEEGPIGMTLAFPDTTYANVNRAFAEMLGYPKAEIIGRSFLDFTDHGDHSLDRSFSQKLFDKSIPGYEIEKRYVTKSGGILWCRLSASAIRDINGEPLFRLAVVENITAQKEAERSIRESEEKFRRVFSESPLGMLFIGKDGTIEDANQAFCEMLGYGREETLGARIADLTHPEDAKAGDLPPLDPSGKHPKNVEKRYLRKDREIIWVNVTPLLMKEKDRDSYRILTIVEDITKRKQVEELKTELVSVVSHQLKTPVAEINGYIENMLDGLAGALTDRQRKYLLDMKDIGLENYRLISDLLSMSKIERGVISVDPVPLSLEEIVELSFRDYESLIQKKGLKLIMGGPPRDYRVLADRDKTVETLRNIVNNALKCTDKGSITVRFTREGPFSVIEVEDTGIGMGEETLKKLFTKTRALGAEAGRAGAGLGLYIAKNFMTLQGGDIEAASSPGKGSCFKVKIPIMGEKGA